jgi:hypothetical protein
MAMARLYHGGKLANGIRNAMPALARGFQSSAPRSLKLQPEANVEVASHLACLLKVLCPYKQRPDVQSKKEEEEKENTVILLSRSMRILCLRRPCSRAVCGVSVSVKSVLCA